MANKQLVSDQKRKEVEMFLYKLLDIVDPTHTNSDYYREIFAKMSNDDFYHFFERRLPIRFHYDVFKVEPKMYQIVDAFKFMKKPLLEKLNLPHVYKDKNGKPIQSQECLVLYIHIKRMKQLVAAKSHVALNTEKRDMKTGLLSGEDKGAKQTDREFESLAAFGLEYTMDEFSRFRADAMRSGAEVNNIILNKGFVSDKDFRVEKDDSLAKNMLNVYLLAANIHTNLVDEEYMTPYTARNRQRQIERL